MVARSLTVLLATPRGFCAGVERAIEIVESALAKYGAPLYVRHEIVHNRHVVESLERRGVVFVEALAAVPDDRPVIFSAHGVGKAVAAEAARRGLHAIDAVCPLVTKVHREAQRHHAEGRHVILIGHAGHPEVAGTLGQLPAGAASLIETPADVAGLRPPPGQALAYVTQTTLSVDDTAAVIAALKSRFPAIAGPRREDICYATTNRQQAVKALAARAQGLIVVGAANSSNANRLVDVGRAAGIPWAQRVGTAAEVDWQAVSKMAVLGLTSGASTPDCLVQEVIAAAEQRFAVTVETVTTAFEDVRFRLPRELVA